MANLDRKGHTHNLAANFQHRTSSSPNLPPIGVFWDIENCQVPKGKSALAVAQFIRKKFFIGHREAEFMCVCDISKENKDVIQELNNAQVTIVHINATCKNAADDKLRQSMRRFADIHGHPATIILISGDVNFAADLSDFHHRRHLKIIVLHNNCAPEPLLACAHEYFNFSHLISEIPHRSPARIFTQTAELLVTNLPSEHNQSQIRSRLKQLSDNCGGRVTSVGQRTAVIRFPTIEAAIRACKRMDREDVFGNKISVNFPTRIETESEKSVNRPGKRMLRTFEDTSYEPLLTRPNNSPDKTSFHSFTKTTFPPIPDALIMNEGCSDPPVSDSFNFSPGHNHLTCDLEEQNSTLWKPFLGSNDEPAEFSSSKGSTASTCSSDGSRDDSSAKCLAFSKGSNDIGSTQNDYESTDKYLQHKSPRPRRNSWIAHQSMYDRIPRRRTVSQSRSRHGTPSPSFRFNGSSFSDDFNRNYISPRLLCDIQSSRSEKISSILSNEMDISDLSTTSHQRNSSPVELLVTNLDQTIEASEMKTLLLAAFRQFVMVLHISVTLNAEKNLMAFVKVPSYQDAQFAISQLHRRKIGFKRIIISLANNNSQSLHVLTSEVLTLLQDVPGFKLPLFKFRELFERRYHHSINMSELNKIKDVIMIFEEASGRMVGLNSDYRCIPSPACSENSKEVQAIMEKSFCEIHCPNPNIGKGWAEKESFKSLPFVIFSLKTLSLQVHTLLQTHNNSLPLGSFPYCYEHEFGTLETSEDGVPLEHLIAAVPGVQITLTSLGGKKIQWVENVGSTLDIGRVSPPLPAHLALFSREVIDLLKNNPHCLLSFNKFIPSYHHHFGRQCRVADYGFTKLIELLEAIPHIVQIMGEGNKRLLTLTHRVQVRRFSSDLFRILKSQASKQITLEELPLLYLKCLGREFDVMNYGVCDITDLLADIMDSTIVIQNSLSHTTIGIPKREQTTEEIERTKQFAEEVVELLRHSPQCRMAFNKFIPAYHHHFGRQCRVSDYGFTKLIELLEAVPDVLQILETEDEKVLILTDKQLLRVFADQVAMLIMSSKQMVLPLRNFLKTFTQFFGHNINLENYKCTTVLDLINKISDKIKIIESSDGPLITLVDSTHLKHLSASICQILMEEFDGILTLHEFQQKYFKKFNEECNFAEMKDKMKDLVQIDEDKQIIKLCALQLLARNICILLQGFKGRLPLHQFESAYLQRFGVACNPYEYGFSNLTSLFLALPQIVRLRGKGQKKVIVLQPHPSDVSSAVDGRSIGKSLDGNLQSKCDLEITEKEKELLQIYSPVDLLSDPVPSCVPSPCLQPAPIVPLEMDLIRFDSPVPIQSNMITGTPESSAEVVKFPPQEPSSQDSLSALLLKSLNLSSTNTIPVPGVLPGVSVHERKTAPMRTLLCSTPCPSPGMLLTPSTSPIQSGLPISNGDSSETTKVLIHSCEDLSSVIDSSCIAADATIFSSQSTPTHDNFNKKHIRPRTRIAAQFTNPFVIKR